MKTFKRLFALLAMLFCCSAMFANYYYCEVLTGSKVIEVGNPRYTSDNGESPRFERTVAKRSYLSLTPYTLSDDINNARLYKADLPSEVEKLVKYEIINTSKESYWEHEEYLNCTYLIKSRNNDKYLNDRGRFLRKESAKVFETYADVKNAYQNCEMKDECEIVRNL